jgi:hypothetical protein
LAARSYSHLGFRSSAETWNPAHARVERISEPAAVQKYQGRPPAGWMATPLSAEPCSHRVALGLVGGCQFQWSQQEQPSQCHMDGEVLGVDIEGGRGVGGVRPTQPMRGIDGTPPSPAVRGWRCRPQMWLRRSRNSARCLSEPRRCRRVAFEQQAGRCQNREDQYRVADGGQYPGDYWQMKMGVLQWINDGGESKKG